MAITVQRNNIIVGAISGFEVKRTGIGGAGRGIGATTGECTLRREVEYFDVDVEQAFGTIRKSPVSDKRFLSVSTAEASLQRLLEAWNDDQSISSGVDADSFDRVQSDKAFASAKFYTATGTDLGEDLPRGLASSGSTIFMIGNTDHATGGRRLYRINTLGQTSAVSDANTRFNFGVGTDGTDNTHLQPFGLTVHNNVLYTIGQIGGSGNVILYSLNQSSGLATSVGPLGSGTIDDGAFGLASNGTTMWAIAQSASARNLYTVNVSTGGATRVGSSNGFGVTATGAAGLAHGTGSHNNLYALLQTASGWALYLMDKSDGSASQVGSAVNFGLDTTSYGTVTPTGMTYFAGDLWVADSTQDGLIKLDAASGTAVAVGDQDTMYLNNMPTGGNIDNLEKEVKIIVPGDRGRFRAYKFWNCVSVAPAEHMYQKNGVTMVPYEFEVLVDPNRTDGQYGVIKDFPTLVLAEAF